MTAAPTAPVVIDRLLMFGAGTTVKFTPLLFTPLTETTTFPVMAPLGTVTAMLGAILISLVMWQKGRMEEVFLSKELGEDAYGAYCRRVPMIIPFLLPR